MVFSDDCYDDVWVFGDIIEVGSVFTAGDKVCIEFWEVILKLFTLLVNGSWIFKGITEGNYIEDVT